MLNTLHRPLLSFFLIAWTQAALAKVVRYQLEATQAKVNLSGKAEVDWALQMNGTIPAPTLEFVEGDDAEIEVRNRLSEEVSVHWHGLLLPPEMDGVAYVNTMPIRPGATHTFRFKLRQSGTYWYHSHTTTQEQKGLYGAIVIRPQQTKKAYERDVIVVLSDWSDEDAEQILKNLRKDGDYYLYKKKSMRSIWGAYKADALGSYWSNELSRMGGMDLSDVGYDAFLLNGKREWDIPAKGGERLRVRIINAAASSYFHVALGGGPLQVIAADGMDVKPVLANDVLMGMAETYDVLVQVPAGKKLELRATAQDGSGQVSAWIGQGDKVFAPDKPKPDFYAPMDHSTMGHAAMDHSKMDHSKMGHVAESGPGPIATLTVDALSAPKSTKFPPATPVTELKLVLGGDMERYVWHINGKAIHEERNILIKEGQVLRFVFENETMMHHPMHLHGHFFRVLNDQGDFSPLKHTVDVPPHSSRTIEFLANEPGEWMLHCHNLYHQKTGMARVIKYTSYQPKPELAAVQNQDHHAHDHPYYRGKLKMFTNQLAIELHVLRHADAYEAMLSSHSIRAVEDAEMSLNYRRWLSSFLSLYGGGHYKASYSKAKTRVVLGVGYVLPLLIEAHLSVDHLARFGLGLDKSLQWTSELFSELQWEAKQGELSEFKASLLYGPTWAWAVGLTLSEGKPGIGGRFRF